MAGEYIFRFFLYGLDGAFWTLSIMWILTKFYGYEAKPSGNRQWIFALAIFLYDGINLILYYLAAKHNQSVGVINGILVLFFWIYWMIYLKGLGGIKRFFVIMFSLEFCVCIYDIIACMFSVLNLESKGGIVFKFVLIYLQLVFVIAFFWWISWLSSRNRKEPMRFSLVISTVIMCMLLDMIMDFFQVEGYEELQPIIKLRLVLPEEAMDQAMSAGILIIIMLFVLLFILMIIRESEADYFHKKNTVNEYYLETQKNHYESLMESSREIRRIKHDMNNHIYCLQSLYQKENYEELGTYLAGLCEHLEQADCSIHVGNEIADAILSEKNSKAQAQDIRLDIEGDMYGVALAALDVCTIFSNMLDNAMEAVSCLSAEQRVISVSIRKNNHFLLIHEKNYTEVKPVIEDGQIKSTKKNKDRHGFGISNIKEAAAKYDGDVQIAVTENEEGNYEFVMEIMIPY